jgi:hypothetical protein
VKGGQVFLLFGCYGFYAIHVRVCGVVKFGEVRVGLVRVIVIVWWACVWVPLGITLKYVPACSCILLVAWITSVQRVVFAVSLRESGHLIFTELQGMPRLHDVLIGED